MDQLMKLGPFAALSKLWNELNASQRVVVTAFVALACVGIIVIGMVMSKPHMAVLFSRLEPEDAGAIAQKLSEQKVPYQLSADNSTIEVPANKVDDMRLQMVSAGLPQGSGVGFELFDKSSFGMTEFTERVTYQRALAGELARTIEHLSPVTKARVLLSMPEDKLYTSEQDPTTASVVLELKRGMPLTDDQVAGVVHLVASAVEGLKPSNITVLDGQGAVLSESQAGGGDGRMLTSNQSKLKRQYEAELAQNLQTMLAKIVGPDKAVVRVSADMSFDQKQIKSESYEPAATRAGQTGATQQASTQGVLLSEEKKSETYNGSVVPPSAVGGAVRARSSSGDSYTLTESNAQYQVTKTIEETVSAPGQLTRLSVAVLMDDKVEQTKVAAIREAVSAAAGINETRGDKVTVQRVAFDTETQKAQDAAVASAAKSDTMKSVAKNAGAVILLLVFLVFLRSTLKQVKVQVPARMEPAMVMPAPIPGATAARDLGPQTYAPPEASVSNEGNFSTAPASDAVPREVEQSSPEDLARLVRAWMSEGG